ncbi:hypothetical protein PAESOLCIP111_05118 [Paenibacillus solanacearum]|uniref:Uncharacterized protein n=1 Tax=Paenibacillus solanacearum TaxID=2048548 RepID=A0A916K5J5_9BACL|nr:hypothetical protein PAESOLCIP111_05118 [Paenibacillus solanacearum]
MNILSKIWLMLTQAGSSRRRGLNIFAEVHQINVSGGGTS